MKPGTRIEKPTYFEMLNDERRMLNSTTRPSDSSFSIQHVNIRSLCCTLSSWPAGPALGFGPRVGAICRSNCCRSSTSGRCSARRSIGSQLLIPPDRIWPSVGTNLVAAVRSAIAGDRRANVRRRAVPAQHGAVHRPGGAADAARRSRRGDARVAGRSCDRRRRRRFRRR